MQTVLTSPISPEVIAEYHEKSFAAPVIGVTGGKGGVGKTTVAVNVAYALATLGYKVALVDADVDGPNAAILLGMDLEHVNDVFITFPLIDENKCNACGECVKACRLNALFLPKGKKPLLLGACNGCEACFLVCEQNALSRGTKVIGKTYKTSRDNLILYTGELIPSQEESALVVRKLKDRVFSEAAEYDLLIVDTAPGAHCNVIHALQGADMVVAVTEPTPFGIHDLGLILQLMDLFALKGKVIINRADLSANYDEIKQMIHHHKSTIAAEIATDELLINSHVNGIPVVKKYPEAESAKVFIKLARQIATEFLA